MYQGNVQRKVNLKRQRGYKEKFNPNGFNTWRPYFYRLWNKQEHFGAHEIASQRNARHTHKPAIFAIKGQKCNLFKVLSLLLSVKSFAVALRECRHSSRMASVPDGLCEWHLQIFNRAKAPQRFQMGKGASEDRVLPQACISRHQRPLWQTCQVRLWLPFVSSKSVEVN